MLVAGRAWREETTMTCKSFDVEVPGGSLRVGQWGDGPAGVAAVHALTGTHMRFEVLADQLGTAAAVLAPDLRGRGAPLTFPPHNRGSGPRW
jgi:lipase